MILSAKIIAEDGRVIEKQVETKDIPGLSEFDMSSKEGFYLSLDQFETAVLNTREELISGLAEGYLKEAAKKGGLSRKSEKRCE